MIFANLMGEKGVGTFKRSTRKNTIPFENSVSEIYEEKRVVFKDGKLQVTDGSAVDDIFMKDIIGREGVYCEKLGSMTINELKDTEDNPLFAVLSDGVKFYEGIPSLIKYIHIEDDMFVLCLMYGACEFACSDGTYIPMTRNITVNIEGRPVTPVFTDAKLKNMSSSIDSESDYDMAYDMVNAVLVDVKNEYVSKYKTIRDAEFIFSTVNRDERRALLEERRLAKEAEIARKREENKKFMEDRRKKEAQLKEEAVQAQFKKPTNVKVPKAEVKKEEGSVGAKNFMAALRNMGYKK